MPFTPRGKKAVQDALRESLTLGHPYIGTEHLLLALLRDCDSDGSQVAAILAAVNVRPDSIREAAERLLRGYEAAGRATAAADGAALYQAAAGAERPGLDAPEVKALRAVPAIPKGLRGDAILLVMNAAGKSGCGNDEILRIGSELCDRWGKHPSTGPYQHWMRLLGMLRNVRSHYPNPSRVKGA